MTKGASLPTITCEKIGAVISNGEVVREKGETTVSTSGSPLLDVYIGDALESAEKRDEHVPVQRIPNKPCTAEHKLLRMPKTEGEREREREGTNAGVSVSVEEAKGVEVGEVAAVGLPAPRGEMWGVGFVGGDAIPALEDLLARVVVPGSTGGVVDPRSVGIVAGTAVDLEGAEGVGGGCGRGVPELGEEEEDGGEAKKREKREKRDSLLCVLLVRFPCARGHATHPPNAAIASSSSLTCFTSSSFSFNAMLCCFSSNWVRISQFRFHFYI